jgi:hypothetical protein
MTRTNDPMPVIFLITGYARAGKDTLADGIIQANSGCSSRVRRVAFADSLKDALDGAVQRFFPNLSYFDNAAKIEDRPLLVEFGRAMRRRNRDVFVQALIDDITVLDCHYIVTDCRYLNEARLMQRQVSENFRVVTVLVETAGVGPANEEEGLSIGEMVREIGFDHVLRFQPNQAHAVEAEGRRLANLYGIR